MIESAVGLGCDGCDSDQRQNWDGVEDVLEAIVKTGAPPKGLPENPLQALIFDSWFDPYRGVIVLVRVFEGTLRRGQKDRLWWNSRVLMIASSPSQYNSLRRGMASVLKMANGKTDRPTEDLCRHYYLTAIRS